MIHLCSVAKVITSILDAISFPDNHGILGTNGESQLAVLSGGEFIRGWVDTAIHRTFESDVRPVILYLKVFQADVCFKVSWDSLRGQAVSSRNPSRTLSNKNQIRRFEQLQISNNLKILFQILSPLHAPFVVDNLLDAISEVATCYSKIIFKDKKEIMDKEV